MHEIDGDFVIETLPFHFRDNSRRGTTPPRGYKRAGKGRGFGFDYEQDYSDSVDNRDYYYSRYSTPCKESILALARFARADIGVGMVTGVSLAQTRSPKTAGGSATLRRNCVMGTCPYRNIPQADHPVAEEAGEQEASHVPTAERVYRIFHGGNAVSQPSKPLSDEEELLEIDYADLGRFINEVEATAASSSKNTKTTAAAAAIAATDIATGFQDEAQQAVTTTEEGPTDFYTDTKPSPVQDSSTSTNGIAVEYPGTGILGEDIGEDDDDEIIVYVAPHPRNGKLASAQNKSSPLGAKAPSPPADLVPVATPVRQKTYDAPHAPALPPSPEPKSWPVVPKDIVVRPPSAAPALAFKNFSFSLLSSSLKPTHRARWPRRIAHRKAERNMMFGSFGAMRAEATLHELDPRQVEQRRGDSDVDWGDSTSGVAEVEENEEDGRGMLVDQDIGADEMTAFSSLKSSSSPSAARIPARRRPTPTPVTSLPCFHSHSRPPLRLHLRPLGGFSPRPQSPALIDMMREDLDQEQETDDDLGLDSDMKTALSRGYKYASFLATFARMADALVLQDFLDQIDNILCAKGRKLRRSAIHNCKFKIDLNDFIGSSLRPPHIFVDSSPAHSSLFFYARSAFVSPNKAARKHLGKLERITAAVAVADPFTPKKRGKVTQSCPKGSGVRQPRDSRGIHSALRGGSRERSNALAPADGMVRTKVGALACARLQSKEQERGKRLVLY
ncbi:hypothetical protein H4582DRAFT_2103206 [Lactarius indigo]|nr:hypothetical protein H4582DRAFT_2103206 [Lactarius indigo]